jgi:aquaporin Z
MRGLATAFRRHWPEYLMEAALLAAFMVSALSFTTLLEHPASPVHRALPDPVVRRALMGLAMGTTAVMLVYSPWGQRSGAHFNPALTLTYARLGKVAPADAAFYVAFQFAGAAAGTWLAVTALREAVGHPAVHFAVTVPGAFGVGAAFVAEAAISFGLMLTVLVTSNRPATAPYTPLFAGALVATYITLEAPISGMSMNPARTFGSASGAGVFDAFWLYCAAPLAGMLTAAECYRRAGAVRAVHCAKLYHGGSSRCIFCGGA